MDYIEITIRFLGSFGLFIFGISLLSSGLQKTAGGRMKRLLGNVSKNRFSGVLFGAGVTAAIQSSTATTVMAVGFVNAGIIALPQIVGIVMGANIGSTATSWLVSSVEWSVFLKPDALGAVCAAVGALLLLFSKEKRIKNIGEVIVGFGVLFLGLSQMPAALAPLAQLEVIREFFITMGANPLLGILAGILVTGIIQSSAASIGILQSMAFAGMVPWNAAVYIVLGQNIGTCLTALISSIGTSKNARAASYVHLVYNVIGAAFFCIVAVIFFAFIDPALGRSYITATNISMVHTGYNVLALILLFPFGKLILEIAKKMAGIGKADSLGSDTDLPELDESILETPSYALENSMKAIQKLLNLMRTNLILSVTVFTKKDYKRIVTFWNKSEEIDKVSGKINEFLTKLYNEEISKQESSLLMSFMHVTISLRRINNRTKGITKLAEDLRSSGIKEQFSGLDELEDIYRKTVHCYDGMVEALKSRNSYDIIQTMLDADAVVSLREVFKSKQLALASKSTDYSVEVGLMYSEVARHLARIAHNIKSIVEIIPHSENVNGVVNQDEVYDRR
ncbi:MAG: Na/Pi cotransporter family protein [Oscillospiraceae bacterium]|jgi:phosphate:Na+ symporter|nr:Na/Pi cotransporter family protein [Oscillospiraceae bacterium]